MIVMIIDYPNALSALFVTNKQYIVIHELKQVLLARAVKNIILFYAFIS